jgi:tRNA dimethylallyltransferase
MTAASAQDVAAAAAITTAMPPLLVIAGPTATGKTGLSIDIARTLRGEGIPAELISADSRQVYRGLDIGTAKVSLAARADVPHHGLDLVDPDEPFSVADFVRLARLALAGIAANGGLAILAGGTGLYLRAIGRGLDVDALPADPAIRARINAQLDEPGGLHAAVARLRELAPTRAAEIDLRNPRRVARTLEIAELLGDQPLPPAAGYSGPIGWLGLDLPDEKHRAWIRDRATAQFHAGLIEEARALDERYDRSLPAFSAIGYHEAWAVIDGRLTTEAAIDEDVRRNVAFARRQRTWFKAEREIRWLDAGQDQVAAGLSAARALLEARAG